MELYVGGQAWSIAGERDDLLGARCWSAAHPCQATPANPGQLQCLLDSGAFTDAPEARLTPAAALERQLRWEAAARRAWNAPGWHAEALVSYDQLIDETWTNGHKAKRRWSLAAATRAVEVTITAAAYLAERRQQLHPRALVLACQGVECHQYAECAREVLRHARPGDWLGLGGWCLLGRAQSLLPEFGRALRAVLPLAVASGLTRIHLFGVLWEPALACLQWWCDHLGLIASCDSAAPVLACTRGDPRKAGVRAPGWRANVAWWRARLATLRGSPWYCAPARELW